MRAGEQHGAAQVTLPPERHVGPGETPAPLFSGFATIAAMTASEAIDKKIAELDDWRGETLSRIRELIHEADAEVVEEWKWAKATSPGTPVFSHSGGICTGETYKDKVKLTFFKGASLEDPKKLFNSSLDGNARRAIDIGEGEKVNAAAFKALIREAVAFNQADVKARAARKK
jgi:hypothetical protein